MKKLCLGLLVLLVPALVIAMEDSGGDPKGQSLGDLTRRNFHADQGGRSEGLREEGLSARREALRRGRTFANVTLKVSDEGDESEQQTSLTVDWVSPGFACKEKTFTLGGSSDDIKGVFSQFVLALVKRGAIVISAFAGDRQKLRDPIMKVCGGSGKKYVGDIQIYFKSLHVGSGNGKTLLEGVMLVDSIPRNPNKIRRICGKSGTGIFSGENAVIIGGPDEGSVAQGGVDRLAYRCQGDGAESVVATGEGSNLSDEGIPEGIVESDSEEGETAVSVAGFEQSAENENVQTCQPKDWEDFVAYYGWCNLL